MRAYGVEREQLAIVRVGVAQGKHSTLQGIMTRSMVLVSFPTRRRCLGRQVHTLIPSAQP